MAEIKLCSINSRGYVCTSRVSDEDQMTVVMQCFFFMI